MTKTMVYPDSKGVIVLNLHCNGNDLNCVKVFLHKSYAERIKLLNFDQNLQRYLFLKFEFLNYLTLIKTYINMPYKRIRNLQPA